MRSFVPKALRETRSLFWIVLCLPLLGAQDDAMGSLLLALALFLPAAKLGGFAAEALRQPVVVGELVAGIVLGNLGLFGLAGFEYLKREPSLDMLANLGVILLLFEVGLESGLADLLRVGLSSLLVAMIGVIVPFGLGVLVSAFFFPDNSMYAHAFIGATLSATSIGITARVLRDIEKTRTREARIVLGAAVIDDVLGLIILAIVSGMILAAGEGKAFTAGAIGWLLLKVVLFLAGSLLLGLVLVPRLLRQAAKLPTEGMLFSLALAFCFLLAYLATSIDLAAIVGAFAAGLILERVPFGEYLTEEERSLEDLLHPISAFLVPLFFVQMGLRMDLTSLARLDVLGFTLALTAAAIVGKQVCGLGALERGLNRIAIGIGMVPRGEVGLIFAGVGSTLTLGGERVVDDATFAAIVVMVMGTTLIAPPLLQWSFGRWPQSSARRSA